MSFQCSIKQGLKYSRRYQTDVYVRHLGAKHRCPDAHSRFTVQSVGRGPTLTEYQYQLEYSDYCHDGESTDQYCWRC